MVLQLLKERIIRIIIELMAIVEHWHQLDGGTGMNLALLELRRLSTELFQLSVPSTEHHYSFNEHHHLNGKPVLR